MHELLGRRARAGTTHGDGGQASVARPDRGGATPAGKNGTTCRIGPALALDGYGLRDQQPPRPASPASDPVSVRQVTVLLHASFRPRLTTTPLRFANPSPPSGWVEDFHLRAVVHARHTAKARFYQPGLLDEFNSGVVLIALWVTQAFQTASLTSRRPVP